MHVPIVRFPLALTLVGAMLTSCSDSKSGDPNPVDPEESTRKRDAAAETGTVDAGKDTGADPDRRDSGRDADIGRRDGGDDKDATCSPGAIRSPTPYTSTVDAGANPSTVDGGKPWTTGYATTNTPSNCTGTYKCSEVTEANCTDSCFIRKCRNESSFQGCHSLQKAVFQRNTQTADTTIAKNKSASDTADVKPKIKQAKRTAYDRSQVTRQSCGGGGLQDIRNQPQYPPTMSPTITSCEDYVDKKFYTYSRFDQLAAQNQEDPRKLLSFLSGSTCSDTGAAYITNCVNKKKFDITNHLRVLDDKGLDTLAIDGSGATYAFGELTGTVGKNRFVSALPSKFQLDNPETGTKKGNYGYDYPRRPSGLDGRCPTCTPVYFDTNVLGPGASIVTLAAKRYSVDLGTQAQLSSILAASGYKDADLDLRYDKGRSITDAIDTRRIVLSVANVYAAKVGQTGTGSQADWDAYITLYKGLQEYDRVTLHRKIEEGQKLGCFDNNAVDANGQLNYIAPCDWAPRNFSSGLAEVANGDAIDKAREFVLTQCRAVTDTSTGTFSYNPTLYAAIKAPKTWPDYLVSVRAFDGWFADIAAYKLEGAKDMFKCLEEAKTEADSTLSNFGKLGTQSSTKPKRLGSVASEDGWEGDDKLFAAGFSHISSRWIDSYAQYDDASKTWKTELGGKSTYCKSRVNSDIGLSANGVFFGANFTFADMFLGLQGRPSTGDRIDVYENGRMKLLGRNLWINAPTGLDAISDAYQFALPPETKIGIPEPLISSQFWVAGVPVTVAGYTDFELGYDGSFSKTTSSTCALPPTGFDVKADATLSPHLGFDAIVEVAVGIDPVAELGIRGHLSLLRFTANLGAKARLYVPTSGGAQVTFSAGLEKQVSSLDGSLSFFAELMGDDVTDWIVDNPEIFAWRGKIWNAETWKTKDITLTLPSCRDALHNGGKNTN